MGREIRIQGVKADRGTVIAWPDWSKGYAAEAVQSDVKWRLNSLDYACVGILRH